MGPPHLVPHSSHPPVQPKLPSQQAQPRPHRHRRQQLGVWRRVHRHVVRRSGCNPERQVARWQRVLLPEHLRARLLPLSPRHIGHGLHNHTRRYLRQPPLAPAPLHCPCAARQRLTPLLIHRQNQLHAARRLRRRRLRLVHARLVRLPG